MSAALSLLPVAMASTNNRKNLFVRDAALPADDASTYINRRTDWAEARAAWLSQIEAEQLQDFRVDDITVLTIDPRDGALCRGGGGLAFTPRAIQQLVSLIRADKPYDKFTAYTKGSCPAGATAQCLRWEDPATRAAHFADVMSKTQHVKAGGKGQRRGKGEVQLRKFRDPSSGLPALRAVVSDIHALTHTDDKAVVAVLDSLKRPVAKAFITRRCDETYASFVLDSKENDSVSLGFTLRNSETGGVSLQFGGSLLINTLDTVVMMPSGRQYEKSITVANANARTKRRHTLPRFSSVTGDRLSETARAAIAHSRIDADIQTALNGSIELAEAWDVACEDIHPLALAAAEQTDDKFIAQVLGDLLKERGFAELSDDVVKVIVNDQRLTKLPKGSAAHMAAAFAVLAADGTRDIDSAQTLMQHAGAFILAGWKATVG